jgi:hypothetical protein
LSSTNRGLVILIIVILIANFALAHVVVVVTPPTTPSAGELHLRLGALVVVVEELALRHAVTEGKRKVARYPPHKRVVRVDRCVIFIGVIGVVGVARAVVSAGIGFSLLMRVGRL